VFRFYRSNHNEHESFKSRAHRTAARFPSSVVLTQDSPGVCLEGSITNMFTDVRPLSQHCSLSGPSLCTPRYIRRYLEDGILPPVGTICPALGKLFPSIPGIPTFDQETLGESDRDLLDAVVALSQSVKSPIGRPFGLF
jgi:hypothetical protein